VALGTGGLVYRAAGQSPAAPGHGEGKPLSELEVLRKENELLKLNLQVVLEKIRSQEADLRSLRAQLESTRSMKGMGATTTGTNITLPRSNANQVADGLSGSIVFPDVNVKQALSGVNFNQAPSGAGMDTLFRQVVRSEPLQEVDAALKSLRSAKDKEERRRALDNLEKALKVLRENLNKQEGLVPR
jgi:hypothetical protein